GAHLELGETDLQRGGMERREFRCRRGSGLPAGEKEHRAHSDREQNDGCADGQPGRPALLALRSQRKRLVIFHGPDSTTGGEKRWRYSPATVMPSMRSVGAAMEPRKSSSLAISEMFWSMSRRLPATVISSTGKASSPFRIHRPVAPR